VYFFALHPDVLKKAREEVLEVLGPEGAPTTENMRELKYGKSQSAKRHRAKSLMDSTHIIQCEPY